MPIVRTLCCALLLSLGLGGLVEPASAQTTRTVTRTLDLDPDGHLELDTFTGTIEVTTWDQNRVEMKARIEDESAELVNKTAIRVEGSARHRTVEADYDEVEDSQKFLGLFNIGDVDRPDVHFAIKMPRSARLSIDDFSSEIDVQGLRADVTLETFSSSVRLRDVKGALDLETFSGSIEGKNLRGRFRLETFSGDVRLRMAALMEDSKVETFSGDVEMVLPPDAGFEIVGEDGTFEELSSEFALKIQDGRRIAGEGGPRIEVETFSGSVRLRKQ